MDTGMPISVVFSLDAAMSDISKGVYEIEGLLHFDGESMQFEYRTTELSKGRWTAGPVRTLKVASSEIRSIEFRATLFGSRLILTPGRLSTFEHLPGDHSSHLILGIPRKSRAAARNLASLFESSRA